MNRHQQFQSAASHHRAGRLAQAEKIYQEILLAHPDQVDALFGLGTLAGQSGRWEMAQNLLRRVIALQPSNGLAHNNLANTLKATGRLDEAIASYRQTILLMPTYAIAHSNLGDAFRLSGDLDNAIASCRKAIELQPDYAEAHYNLALALQFNSQLQEAVASYRHAIHFKPDYLNAYHNLGNALYDLRQLDEAIAAYRQAIRFKPDLPDAHANLAVALTETGQSDEAVACCRRAIDLNPGFAKAYNNLGNVLQELGQLDEAIAAYRRALELEPDYAAAHSNLNFVLLFHPNDQSPAIFEQHTRWNHQHAKPLKKFIQPHSNNRDPNRRLRVGYVSADFREHSVSCFLLPLLRCHDHHAFEIICYSDVSKSDRMTDALRACADRWQNIVGLTDPQVAEKIRQDPIDILIDLAGHTARNRLRVFAQKPAPIQISYLGYPATTGLEAMDWRLTDNLADPPGQTESLYTEQLLRLPVCNWCFAEPQNAPPVQLAPVRPVCFGSFNNFAKASAQTLDLWAAILRATPSSRFILKSRGLTQRSVQHRFSKYFSSRGIQAHRLHLLGHEPDMTAHLDLYNQMDIALDTFPYHGTTTTCQALWMGVPVVTLAGPTHVSRVGVSLLTSVGLPELIAQSPDQYISIARNLANDPPRVAELRQTLRAKMRASPLMDAPRFARDVQTAYRRAWHEWISK